MSVNGLNKRFIMKLREIIIKKYRYNNAAGGNQINVTVTVEK
jgi:hypothetical protein